MLTTAAKRFFSSARFLGGKTTVTISTQRCESGTFNPGTIRIEGRQQQDATAEVQLDENQPMTDNTATPYDYLLVSLASSTAAR